MMALYALGPYPRPRLQATSDHVGSSAGSPPP
jgi:hypothetical protein